MSDCIPLIYIPTLHRELVPPGLPEGISTCWPGLPLPDSEREGTFCPDFVWSPVEAAACLEDLKRLEPEAARAALALEADMQGRKRRTEMEDLDVFAGRIAADDSCVPRESRIRAQRLLLTAWLQEDRVRDMKELAERYARSAAALAEMLDDGTGGGEREAPVVDAAALLPSWRFVLEQLALFLPPDAVLCSADPAVRDALNEAGLCLAEPVPEDLELLPPAWRQGIALRAERVSLRRLLGRTGSASGRPWLDRVFLTILADVS